MKENSSCSMFQEQIHLRSSRESAEGTFASVQRNVTGWGELASALEGEGGTSVFDNCWRNDGICSIKIENDFFIIFIFLDEAAMA